MTEKRVCGFCKGQPVGNAATWIDGKPRPPAPCPRCGETAQVLPPDEITDDNRFAVMELRDGRPHEIAATCRDGLGLCLVTLAEDRREAGDNRAPVLGVLDRLERRWVSGLWPGGTAA